MSSSNDFVDATGYELEERLKSEAQAVADNAPNNDTSAWVDTATALLDNLHTRVRSLEAGQGATDYARQARHAAEEAQAKAELAKLILDQAQGLAAAWRKLRRTTAQSLRKKAREVEAG